LQRHPSGLSHKPVVQHHASTMSTILAAARSVDVRSLDGPCSLARPQGTVVRWQRAFNARLPTLVPCTGMEPISPYLGETPAAQQLGPLNRSSCMPPTDRASCKPKLSSHLGYPTLACACVGSKATPLAGPGRQATWAARLVGRYGSTRRRRFLNSIGAPSDSRHR
jgi:hypothetical protein